MRGGGHDDCAGDPHLLSVAENANMHQPLGPRDERIQNDRFVLWMGEGDHPSWNVVQRLRLTAETLDSTIAEVHTILRERDRHACTWEIGTSATPGDLLELLRARGLEEDADPDVAAMVLFDEPPFVEGVEARPARDYEELVSARAVAWTAFGMERDPDEEADRARWREETELGHSRTFVALVDGELVASGTSTYVEGAVTLNGGAVLPDARGRGAYRALVRARWEDAVTRGTPILVTQAGRMSLPILERVGFREVARIHILVDRFGP